VQPVLGGSDDPGLVLTLERVAGLVDPVGRLLGLVPVGPAADTGRTDRERDSGDFDDIFPA